MAVVDLSLDLTISDQCPDYVFTDDTDYLPVKKRFTFKLNDYTTGGTPTASTTFTLSQIHLVDTVYDLMSTSVSIVTDGAGEIESPETTYQSLINSIQGVAGTPYIAVLNKNGSDEYKNWQRDVSRFVSDTTILS